MNGKILVVSNTPFWGGGEAYCAKLVEMLSERYEVGAVVANSRLGQLLYSISVPTWKLYAEKHAGNLRRYLYAAFNLARAIREFKPDVVHLNGQSETYFASIPRWFQIPITSTRHTNFDDRVSRLKRFLATRNLQIIERTVCVSSLLMRQLSNVVDEQRLIAIPNWLDSLPVPLPYGQRSPGKPFRLLYVGRIVRDKGIYDLIEAVRILDDVSLSIVGDGEELNNAIERAHGLPIEFHGFQADCSIYFRDANLLVFPSYHEGHPFVPIEAMAHGLPCLLSDIPTNRETTCDGSTAELFACGNVIDLAAKIRKLQHDEGRLSSLSMLGVELVRRNFTRDQIKKQYFNLFDELISEKSKGGLECNET